MLGRDDHHNANRKVKNGEAGETAKDGRRDVMKDRQKPEMLQVLMVLGTHLARVRIDCRPEYNERSGVRVEELSLI